MVIDAASLDKKVKRIEIFEKRYVESFFSGMYASAFKGKGIDIEEIREFREGDDIRDVSWTKTASMGRPFVKELREERDLTVMLVVDVSGSMNMSSLFEQKREMVAEIGALIALSAMYNHDRVGLILYSDRIEKHIKPKRGMRHGARLIRELIGFEPASIGTDLKGALEYLYTTVPRRSICFVLSDFIDGEYEKILLLAAKKHELIAVRMQDVTETSMPTLGVVRFHDLETGEEVALRLDKRFVKAFEEVQADTSDAIKKTIFRSGAGFLDLTTEEPFLERLHTFFAARRKRR